MKRRYIILALSFLLPVSCVFEKVAPVAQNEGIRYTLSASVADATKALISDEGVFSWEAGDKAAVLDSKTGDICIFTCEEGDGEFSFTGEPGRTYNFTKAWYPASMLKSAGVVTFPASWTYEQICEAHTFPMAASVKDGNMSFYHVAGILKVSINDVPKDATSLTISSDDVSLSGDFSITELGLDDGRIDATGEDVVVEDTEIPLKSVPEIVSGAGAGIVSISLDMDSKQDIQVYVPLPCGSYRYKVALKVGDTAVLERTTTSAKVIDRAVMLKMHPLTVSWPAVSLKASYSSTETVFEPSDLWGWYVARSLPVGADITIIDAADGNKVYGTRAKSEKHVGYLCECSTGEKFLPFLMQVVSDLYYNPTAAQIFPLAAGTAGAGIVVPTEYEVAHFGLRGDFGEGTYTSKGIFTRTDDQPADGEGWAWYVVRNVLCTKSPVQYKFYSTPYNANKGMMVTSTNVAQNIGVRRSLISGQTDYGITYRVSPGMSYDFYIREDLAYAYACEAGTFGAMDDSRVLSLTSFGLYDYGGSSYVCASGLGQTWTTPGSFTIVDGLTFDTIQISGLAAVPTVNDKVTLSVKVGNASPASVSATVLKVDGSKVWLLSDEGSAMIVNVQ